MGKFMEMDRDVSELQQLAERVRARAEKVYWNDKAAIGRRPIVFRTAL